MAWMDSAGYLHEGDPPLGFVEHAGKWSAPETRPTSSTGEARALVALGLSVLMGIGSLGPWATFFALSVAGTAGDGVITLIAAVIGGVMAIALKVGSVSAGAGRVVLGLVGLVGLGVASYDGSKLASESGELVQLGWGLWLVGISGLGLLILVLVSLSHSGRPAS